MKKLLLTLALVSSVSAFAQSTVSIYGTFDDGIRHDTRANAAGNSNTRMSASVLNATKFGFVGTDKLDGGQTLNFKFFFFFAVVPKFKLGNTMEENDLFKVAR